MSKCKTSAFVFSYNTRGGRSLRFLLHSGLKLRGPMFVENFQPLKKLCKLFIYQVFCMRYDIHIFRSFTTELLIFLL